MKKFILLLTIFINTNSFSQNWQLVSSNTSEEIKDMYFKDELIGFAVAGQGKILKTIDGGTNWILIYENSELLQEQSIVVTNDKVYCFGQNFSGVIKKLEFSIDINDFQIATINVAFTPQNPITYNNIIFDTGVKYDNGQFIPLTGPIDVTGSTISNGASQIYNNGNNLTASDGHNIFISSNGDLWDNVQFHLPFLSSDPYQSYYDGIGKMRTVTNYPCVVHISDDNGLSWTYNQTNIQSLYFYFISPKKILGLNLFTEENKIYYSTNSGITFNFETLSNSVKKIYSFNNNLCFAYGNSGVIYKSINNGGLLNTNEIKKNEREIEIFPNPTKNEFNIENKLNKIIDKIEIIDIYGKQIKIIYPNKNFYNLNINDLLPGFYNVNLFSENLLLSVKKLVVQ